MIIIGIMVTNLLFIDGLKEFVSSVWDFLYSIITGLKLLVETLSSIPTLTATMVIWFPSAAFTVLSLAVILIIVLRVVGR